MDEQSIFLEALRKETPEERAAFLSEACGNDEGIRHEVDMLLKAHAKVGDFLQGTPAGIDNTLDQAIEEKPGETIGPYKLLQQLGEGGMGVVYMAEQTEPVERRVALKIIKPGMDTRKVIARFEAERQALAMMDHPNIAKVFDAGTTETGRPYFVMELVKGVPVTQYCDEKQLTPRERLELLVPICQAVQHAHQKGIIHRDIKPTNVLVAEYDDRAVPKIIDFGVAKAIEQRLTEKTAFTEFGQIVGTPEYMSPEQAKLNQLDIDTRTDVYSLGVLLYELLTGETPFDRERLRSAAFDELLRIIREEEPPRPSMRLSTSKSLASIAANRHIPPKELSTLVRGELDWIVMKALEKDRTRRYDTASKFAEDIQHYLNDETVTACPPSVTYKLRKFVWRNRLAVSMSVLIGAILLAGVGGTMWQSSRASRAKQEYLDESNKRSAVDVMLTEQHSVRVSRIPRIQQLLDAGHRFDALELIQRSKEILPDDPVVNELFNRVSASVSIKTNPPDAKIEIRDASNVDSQWRGIGSTPISAAIVPQGPVLIRFSLSGHVTVERLIIAAPEMVIHQKLFRQGELPENMVFVSERTPNAFNGIRANVPSFLADKYEVTNRQFQEFVDAGGYKTPDYWKHEFYKDGSKISWQEAMTQMRDRTGQPGPATWEHGRYPGGEDDYPVRGVSWYEAAAYAEFANKNLPTIHHWATAASLRSAEHIAPFGNYSGSGPAKVGQYGGITESGLFDMAGNVKEWCWNESESGGRWIRGGSWREPTYMFGLQDAASPFLRLPDYGFRCVRYIQPPPASSLATVPMTNYRYIPKEPATPEQIELYRRHFLFDKQRPLNATVISKDSSSEGYYHEIVEIDAAYEDERFKLHVFYPRGVEPPLLPIVFHPGAGSMHSPSIGDSGQFFDIRFVIGLVRGGHVVCWPVYKGTFERRLEQEPPWNSIEWRDLTIQRTKDLIRAVDYLETQPDLRMSKLAFVGFSFGAGQGPLLAAIEPRLRLCAFTCGGLFLVGGSLAPEINPYNFAPEVEAPVLMINGRFDQFFPLDQSQIPLFARLGSQDKTHDHFDSGHATPEKPTIERVNNWLDQHAGGPSSGSSVAHVKGVAMENAPANESTPGRTK